MVGYPVRLPWEAVGYLGRLPWEVMLRCRIASPWGVMPHCRIGYLWKVLAPLRRHRSCDQTTAKERLHPHGASHGDLGRAS